MTDPDHHEEYGDAFVAGLEWMWEASAALVEACGFTDIEWRDRNAWYAQAVDEEIATLTGENYPRLVERLGAGGAARRLESSTRKKAVVDGGELRPGHLRARKPG